MRYTACREDKVILKKQILNYKKVGFLRPCQFLNGVVFKGFPKTVGFFMVVFFYGGFLAPPHSWEKQLLWKVQEISINLQGSCQKTILQQKSKSLQIAVRATVFSFIVLCFFPFSFVYSV